MAELKGESQRRNYVSNEKMPGRVTTREMLLREYQIVSLAHDGISRFWPLAPGFIPKGLADDQKKAVERILNSRNFITLFRGGAGTGKSFALQAVNQGLTEAGHAVLVGPVEAVNRLEVILDCLACLLSHALLPPAPCDLVPLLYPSVPALTGAIP